MHYSYGLLLDDVHLSELEKSDKTCATVRNELSHTIYYNNIKVLNHKLFYFNYPSIKIFSVF